MKDNKLIAEFMGYPTCADYWKKDERYQEEDYKDYYYVHGQYDQCYGSSNFHVNDMKYNLSWDCLMPVIEKIQDIFVDDPELDYQLYDDIRLNVPYLDDTYNAVLYAIKQYNNQNN